MKNSHLCVHAVHKTLNVVISRCRFAEDDKEMYQNVTRTCRAKLPNYGFKTLLDACVINNFFFRRSTGHLYKLLKNVMLDNLRSILLLTRTTLFRRSFIM